MRQKEIRPESSSLTKLPPVYTLLLTFHSASQMHACMRGDDLKSMPFTMPVSSTPRLLKHTTPRLLYLGNILTTSYGNASHPQTPCTFPWISRAMGERDDQLAPLGPGIPAGHLGPRSPALKRL